MSDRIPEGLIATLYDKDCIGHPTGINPGAYGIGVTACYRHLAPQIASLQSELSQARAELERMRGEKDKFEIALTELVAAVPKETMDADWWNDPLKTAMERAQKVMTEAPESSLREEKTDKI
jgi:hypothetical protein